MLKPIDYEVSYKMGSHAVPVLEKGSCLALNEISFSECSGIHVGPRRGTAFTFLGKHENPGPRHVAQGNLVDFQYLILLVPS